MAGFPHLLIVATLSLGLSACASIKMPDVDFFDMPEADEAEASLKYPEVAQAPIVPTDTRSDTAWDQSAREILAIKDEFKTPSKGPDAKTDAEIEAEMRQLRNKVKEYKLDDPQ